MLLLMLVIALVDDHGTGSMRPSHRTADAEGSPSCQSSFHRIVPPIIILLSGDAALLIVMKAVHSANSSNIVLAGGDTDLIVFPCYHASIESHDLFFCLEPKKNTKQPCIWNIKVTKQRLGARHMPAILFLHAVLGCDRTSRLHGIGKGASFKKFQASNSFRQQANVLHTNSASKHDVTCAGDKALVVLYNGNSTDSLDSLRHQRFCEKVSSSQYHDHPRGLSPT